MRVIYATKKYFLMLPHLMASFEARWGKEVFFKNYSVSNPPRGHPFGGGGVHHIWGHGSTSYDFLKSTQFMNCPFKTVTSLFYYLTQGMVKKMHPPKGLHNTI
jgi:hypothetical protein